MSHFSVLVSLPEESDQSSLEEALWPYHEYECTGVKDKYVKFVECIEKKDDLLNSHRNELKENPDETPESFDLYLKEFYDYEVKGGKIGRWTNPNGKWDWWSIGGRWSNRLINNSGESGDHFHKNDIDFNAMMKKSIESKISDYDKAQKAFQGDVFVSYAEIMKLESLNFDDKIEKYNSQPAIIRYRKIFDDSFIGAEYYNMDRESFIKKCEFEGVSTCAILHNGNWIQEGDMGWWGCASNEKEESEWKDIYMKALSEIPDDNYLIVIDCHR